MTDVTGSDAAKVSRLPVRRPEWVAHVLDDATGEPHAILLHLPRGERTALSTTGTRVWQLVVGAGPAGISAADMAPVLAKEYAADPKVVQADVTTLIEQLLAGDWVEPVTADNAPDDPEGQGP